MRTTRNLCCGLLGACVAFLTGRHGDGWDLLIGLVFLVVLIVYVNAAADGVADSEPEVSR